MDTRTPHEELMRTMSDDLEDEGIDGKYLAKLLKEELEATHTVGKKKIPLWDIRQKGRISAHKLRGDFPAEKTQVEFPEGLTIKVVKFADANNDSE